MSAVHTRIRTKQSSNQLIGHCFNTVYQSIARVSTHSAGALKLRKYPLSLTHFKLTHEPTASHPIHRPSQPIRPSPIKDPHHPTVLDTAPNTLGGPQVSRDRPRPICHLRKQQLYDRPHSHTRSLAASSRTHLSSRPLSRPPLATMDADTDATAAATAAPVGYPVRVTRSHNIVALVAKGAIAPAPQLPPQAQAQAPGTASPSASPSYLAPPSTVDGVPSSSGSRRIVDTSSTAASPTMTHRSRVWHPVGGEPAHNERVVRPVNQTPNPPSLQASI